ncbi:MAG: phage portal protein [Caldilineaceae bacterium]
MAILSRLLFEQRAHPKSNHSWSYFGNWGETAAGVYVNEESALTLSAVFACVRVLAEGVAMLPLITYRRNGEVKERASDHPLYRLLKEQPNPEMTSFEFRETLIGHAATWGNGYAEIEWNRAGRPVALWPLRPDRMRVERRAGQLRYDYTLPNGQAQTLQWYQVHHLRGLSGNGVTGYSVIRMAMQGIGLGLAAEEHGARFYGNGARPGGVLEHPGRLSDLAFKRLQDSWNAEHQGLSNAHRMKILEEGLKYTAIGIPPEEAQFIETRKFQVSDIARWFRVPPHMIGDMEGATFSNIEEQGLEFVTYTLAPWLVRSEQALTRDLLTDAEQQTIFIEYLVAGLLRGDIQSRYNAYSIGRQNGWLSANDIRRMENMNPIDGGEVYLVPLNMVPAGGDGTPVTVSASPDNASPVAQDRSLPALDREELPHQVGERRADGEDEEPEQVRQMRVSRQRLANSYIRLYEDVATRVIRREANDMRRAVEKHLRKRSLDSFREWLAEFYRDFPAVLIESFLPLMLALAEQVTGSVADEVDVDDPGLNDELRAFVDGYLEKFANGWVASSQNQVNALIDAAVLEQEEPADLIEERLNGWEETQPKKVALGQAFEAMNALVIATYGIVGVLHLRWASRGESCPFCRSLDGKVIGIKEYFVQAGDSVSAGGDAPMLVRRNTRHGPLHGGCDCVVVAA